MSLLLLLALLLSAALLVYGVARYAWRAWRVRRAEAAAAYRAAHEEANELLARYGQRQHGVQSRFELARVPLELRRSLLDGLQVLAAHTREVFEDDDELYSPASELLELQSAIEVVRTIAEDRVDPAGRKALRALLVDTLHRELSDSLNRYQPGTDAAPGQQAELREHLLPAAREALAWQQDGMTSSHAELDAVREQAEQLLQSAGVAAGLGVRPHTGSVD
jgi:hypothetical protein